MRISIAAALVAAALGTSFASAQTASPSPSSVATKPQEPFDPLVMKKITATLEHKGITGVSNVMSDGDGYKASAVKDTKAVMVWVNPESGEVRMLN